jgi:hypothetical protein
MRESTTSCQVIFLCVRPLKKHLIINLTGDLYRGKFVVRVQIKTP